MEKNMEKNLDLEKTESLNGGKLCQYHRNSSLTWEQSLEADSFAQCTAGEIMERSGEGIKTVISDRTREIIASNDALTREFGAGFDSVNSTLEWGDESTAKPVEPSNIEISTTHTSARTVKNRNGTIGERVTARSVGSFFKIL